MKYEGLLYAAAALVTVAMLLPPQPCRAARNFNLSVNMNNAEHCSDLRVQSKDGEVAQSSETLTLGARDASMIEMDDTTGRAVVQVRGWERSEYGVETCKVAVAESRQAAQQLISGITASHTAGRITTTGPSSDNGNWQVYFLIRAPKNGSLDLQTKNGPISVSGVTGNVKVRATNGPISLRDVGGQVDANSTNGPISFSGGSGEVHLTAQNGPISLELAGESWNGSQLDARTVNGPVSISIPENFRTGVRLHTAGHAPLSCKIEACRNALTDASSEQRTIQLNGSADTIRVSTGNGPVSVSGPKRKVI
jgi:DUF4097 and DUF4098 domain-containing protein YvlB